MRRNFRFNKPLFNEESSAVEELEEELELDPSLVLNIGYDELSLIHI